ncbi:MAG: hypothetical protein CSA34_06065 [Desulfobulbus propionicus]|nr:MAG: hypothetical protein CSA34_06065 [Desulfobulbus propionicus]
MRHAISTLMVLLMTTWAVAEGTAAAEMEDVEVLDLVTAQQIALHGNPQLKAAKERAAQARLRVEQAAAHWWPDLNLTASAQHKNLSDSEYAGNQLAASLYGGNADNSSDTFVVGIQTSWLLFDGFYRRFNQEMAKADERSAEAALVNARRLLATSVAEAFYNAQLAQTNEKIARADETFYLQRLEDAENMFDAGAGARGNILNIKVQLNLARASRMAARRNFEAAGYGLAALLGLPDGRLPNGVLLQPLHQDFEVESVQTDVAALLAQALSQRPDIQEMEYRVALAEAGNGLVRTAFYPQVQIVGTINGARQGDAVFADEDFGSTLSVNLQWNLFNGKEDEARLAEARHQKREMTHNLAALKNAIAAEVRENVVLLEAAKEQVRLQRDTVVLVEENRELAQNAYEAGESSLVRLNEAQRDLTTTHGRLAQALVNFHLARQRLLSVTGAILDPFPSLERTDS